MDWRVLLVIDLGADLILLAFLLSTARGQRWLRAVIGWAWTRGPLWPGAPAFLVRPTGWLVRRLG